MHNLDQRYKGLFIKKKNEISSPIRQKNPHLAERPAITKGAWNWMVKVDSYDNLFILVAGYWGKIQLLHFMVLHNFFLLFSSLIPYMKNSRSSQYFCQGRKMTELKLPHDDMIAVETQFSLVTGTGFPPR